jgi:acyl-CoA reductase-like NAD-dependent aldehyde dehydrogenase
MTTPTFLERARQVAQRKAGAQPCKWSQLPPEYRAAVSEAFAVIPRIDNKVIADEMAKDGFEMDHQAVGRHRTNGCAYCRTVGL